MLTSHNFTCLIFFLFLSKMGAAYIHFPFEYLSEPSKEMHRRITCDGLIQSVDFRVINRDSKDILKIDLVRSTSLVTELDLDQLNIFLLDLGGLSKRRWAALRSEIETAVQYLVGSQTEVLFLFFHREVEWFLVNQTSMASFLKSLHTVKLADSSHLELAFQTLDQILDSRKTGYSKALFMTDGNLTGIWHNTEKLIKSIANIKGRGCQLHFAHLSDTTNQNLLHELARLSSAPIWEPSRWNSSQSLMLEWLQQSQVRIGDLSFMLEFDGQNVIDASGKHPFTRNGSTLKLKSSSELPSEGWELPLLSRSIPPIFMSLNYREKISGLERECVASTRF